MPRGITSRGILCSIIRLQRSANRCLTQPQKGQDEKHHDHQTDDINDIAHVLPLASL